jgi:hypothetical protein
MEQIHSRNGMKKGVVEELERNLKGMRSDAA